MMGLGSGRRSMKSPPLLLAALVACVIVLGFNYWIASSRSVDLQTRILELEGRVRRAAAERGAVELKKNEFQGELEKQRGQLDKIQSSHNFQLESISKMCQDEKAALVNNITSGEKVIRVLQDQFKTLQRNYAKLQQDILQFQRNQSNLERKFSYDLSQCISQMKEVKEQCEERLEEVTRKGNETVAASDKKEQSQQPQEAGPPPGEGQPGKEKAPSAQEAQPPAPNPAVALEMKRVQEKESNVIQVVSQEEPSKGSLNLPQEPGQENVPDPQAVDGQDAGGAGGPGQNPQVSPDQLGSQEREESEVPERDQLIIRDGQEEQDAAGKGESQPKAGGDEYNVEENEEKSEIDKQAAVAESDKGLHVVKAEDEKKNIVNLLDQREEENHTL
ncbi:Golgi membrane protein 1 isoform X2 [Ochotona curzoniae]|uniref:Golgi membrane protein 1 isoform X2 n=1 Tax=Ochotona curzoniae TaxID=130825 RepID=UPI001B34BC85|nr:Golgi membrane protein 1 isoform X2 [Ochotona curzoniae]